MSEPTGKEYTIEKITDLVQLDERQLNDVLPLIKQWVQARQEMQILFDAINSPAIKAAMKDHMVFIDDGIDGISRVDITCRMNKDKSGEQQ